MKEIIRFDKVSDIKTSFESVKIENMNAVLDALIQVQEDVYTTKYLEDKRLLFSIEEQVNLKVYSNIEVGFTGINNTFFDDEYSDLKVGISTGMQVIDNNQDLTNDLSEYVIKSDNLISKWDKLVDELNSNDLPKYVSNSNEYSFEGIGGIDYTKDLISILKKFKGKDGTVADVKGG